MIAASFRATCRAHPAIWGGVLLTGSAAFGEALPQLLALIHRVML